MAEQNIQGSEGEMYDEIQSTPGAKKYAGEAEPLDPKRVGVPSTEGMPEGPDPNYPPASDESVHEAANRAKAAFESAADQGPPAPQSDENA